MSVVEGLLMWMVEQNKFLELNLWMNRMGEPLSLENLITKGLLLLSIYIATEQGSRPIRLMQRNLLERNSADFWEAWGQVTRR